LAATEFKEVISMNVLSVFDGISCGRVALERAGLKVKAYASSEIDKHAIKIAQKNYPDDYTAGTSDAQRYKTIGNGWTVDVIVHILKNLRGRI
jgi:site-specific DNA-cytosine methylase